MCSVITFAKLPFFRPERDILLFLLIAFCSCLIIICMKEVSTAHYYAESTAPSIQNSRSWENNLETINLQLNFHLPG